MTYNEMATGILADSCSPWLRNAVVAMSIRDCCDALTDAQTLEALCDLRVDETMGPVHMTDERTAKMFRNSSERIGDNT